MSLNTSLEAIAEALAEELTAVCGSRLGGEATAAPSELSPAAGWTLSVPIDGSVHGRISVWVDRASAAAYARAILATETAPADDVIANALSELTRDAATALAARDGFSGVQCGSATIGQGPAVPGSRACYVAVANVASCLIAVGVEPQGVPALAAAAADDGSRLGALLDVDLPLVVRFGRTVMPLGAIAELGPGSLIDIGRSTDEPVDLLIGERLIARGEVVVVGGNYGVRITEIAAGREAAAIREARSI
jgi:flagellar motor switch protein FliN/FliY